MVTREVAPAASASGHGRRVGRNFLRLLKGRVASSLLLLVSTALMARSLAPSDFGTVVLVHSYLLLMKGLVNLKPFEAIIRFGVPLLELGEEQKLAQLLRLTFLLDVALALGGAVLAASLVLATGGLFSIGEEARHLAALYCLLLLASASGTASGILRLFNRFDLLGLRQAIGPLAQLGGVLIAWGMGADYRYFLMAFGLGFVVEHAVLMGFGYAELRRQQPGFRFRGAAWSSSGQQFPGLWRFLHIVYWQSNIDLVPKQVSVLLVGALLGSAAAGLFRIAQQITRVLSAPALLLRQVLFPDLARLWYRRDQAFIHLLRRTLLIALTAGVSIALLSLFIAGPAIDALAGSDYLGASSVLSWLLLAAGLDMGIAALRAAGYAMGLAGLLLRVSVLAIVVYLGALVILSQSMGLEGVAIAVVGWACLNLGAFGLVVHRRVSRTDMQPAA